MTTKLPKPGHVPIIGRREQKMACIYVIGLVSAPEPVKIGACVDLRHHFDELQKWNLASIKLRQVYWLPDLNVAKRVLGGVRENLRKHCVRGDVFNVKTAMADQALHNAAKELKIPLMTNPEYRKICRGPEGRRENEIDNFLRSVGIT